MTARRRIAAGLFAVGALAAVGLGSRLARTQRADVWTLKVVFIGKIASFLEWPKDCDLRDPQRPVIWTFYGSTPMEARADAVYRTRRFQGHTVMIRRARTLNEIEPAHLLFIAPSAKEDLPKILARVGDRPILTVADVPGMAHHGVAVNLLEEDEKIRFEINRQALRRAGIRASFRLLSLARIVGEDTP